MLLSVLLKYHSISHAHKVRSGNPNTIPFFLLVGAFCLLGMFIGAKVQRDKTSIKGLMLGGFIGTFFASLFFCYLINNTIVLKQFMASLILGVFFCFGLTFSGIGFIFLKEKDSETETEKKEDPSDES